MFSSIFKGVLGIRGGKLEVSKITDYLYIGTRPYLDEHYDLLRELEIDLIINMIHSTPPYPDNGGRPIRTLWLETHDNWFKPIPMHLLKKGTEEALPVIEAGGKVFVHCWAGRHRSVAQGACILIAADGCGAEEAAKLISNNREKARPKAWHIWRRIKKFEKEWAKKANA